MFLRPGDRHTRTSTRDPNKARRHCPSDGCFFSINNGALSESGYFSSPLPLGTAWLQHRTRDSHSTANLKARRISSHLILSITLSEGQLHLSIRGVHYASLEKRAISQSLALSLMLPQNRKGCSKRGPITNDIRQGKHMQGI